MRQKYGRRAEIACHTSVARDPILPALQREDHDHRAGLSAGLRGYCIRDPCGVCLEDRIWLKDSVEPSNSLTEQAAEAEVCVGVQVELQGKVLERDAQPASGPVEIAEGESGS